MAMAAEVEETTESACGVRERRRRGLEVLRAARCKFEAWERSRYDLMGRMQDLSVSISRDTFGKFEDLKRQSQVLNEQKSEKETKIDSRHQQLEALKKMILQGNERKDYLEKRLALLQERKKAHAHIAVDALKDIEERLTQKQQKVNAQNEAIKWYNNVLGIRAEFSSAIKFIFTKINPRTPEQEFSCTIRLDKHTNKYAMLDCVPYVKRSTDLLDDLNITNEFFDFMRHMRQEFEKLVEESESRNNAVAEWCSQQQQYENSSFWLDHAAAL